MKKSLSAAVLTLVLASSVSAAEWGGRFFNGTNFSGKADDLKLTQKDGISLWGKIPVSKDNRSYLMGEVSYQFKFDDTEGALRKYSNIIDLSLLEGNFDFKTGENSRILIKAGRFPVADGTGSIFTQSSDGVYASFVTRKFDLSVYGGYTGLLNVKNQEMLLVSDYEGSSEYTLKDDDLYVMAPKYIPFSVNFKVPFLAQNFIVQGWGFADCNGDNFNRYYATLGLNGFISKWMAYDVTSTFGTKNFESLTNLSKVNLYAYTGNLMFGANAVYASGSNGKFSSFMGVTKESPVYAKTGTEYSGLFKGGISASVIIAKAVNLSGAFDVVMNCSDGFKYRGVQYSAGANWNIFNDLRLGCNVKQFIGDDSGDDKLSVDLNLTFVF